MPTKIIHLPQLRQTYGFDCGAKALQTVLVYFGIEVREDEVMKFANTSEDGTPVRGIVETAKRYGLTPDMRQMTIYDVKQYLDKETPVILVLQAWTEERVVNWELDWEDGHYVVAVGYTDDRVLFVDPSSFERTYLLYNELESRWHDVDGGGVRYDHYGIALFGKEPAFDEDEIIHMD